MGPCDSCGPRTVAGAPWTALTPGKGYEAAPDNRIAARSPRRRAEDHRRLAPKFLLGLGQLVLGLRPLRPASRTASQ
jgi:hypothetical protein